MIKKIHGMTIEWDTDKNGINKKKHGISFEAASLVFADDHYLELYDDEHSMDEDRYIAIGLVEEILFVVHTMRNENIYCAPVKFAVQPDCRPPARYFPEGITVNPGGLQYKNDFRTFGNETGKEILL